MQISAAIRQMRELMGESQQAFSTRLGISISGLANYELRDRIPPLAVLASLQQIARDRDDIPEEVKKAIDVTFLEELPKSIGASQGMVSFAHSVDGDAGFIFEILSTREEYAYAMAFQYALKHLRQDQEPAREALNKLFDAAAPFMDRGEAEWYIANSLNRGKK